jgi:Concanavalin A-like lectin/glucanases superfamily
VIAPLNNERHIWLTQKSVLNRQSPHAAGLHAWWHMSSSAGQTFVDEPLQHAYGSIPTGGNVFWNSVPEYGTALSFAGPTGFSPNYLSVTNINFAAPLSIAIWCRPGFTNGTGPQAFAKLLSKTHTTPGSDPYGLVMLGTTNTSPARWNIDLSTGIAGSLASAASTSSLQQDVWTHVAFTYESTALRLYVNGVLETSTATTLVIGSNNILPTFGTHGTDIISDSRWRGDILEARWYGRALHDAEMWQLYDPATRWDLYAPVMAAPWARGAAMVAQPHVQVIA